jgi:hypothetical protein
VIKATYILRSKSIDLGKVEFDDEDWPWYRGRFIPFESFASCADIFRQEELLPTGADCREERDKLQRQIVLMELRLIDAGSGKLAGEPDILWIRHGRVSWRGHTGALRPLYRDTGYKQG